MHETKILKEIIRKAEEQGHVNSVSIEVGELAGIEAEHLKEHLEVMADWDVDTKTTEAKVRCDCGFKGRPKITMRGHDFVLFECPECGEVPEVVEGDDIKLKEVKCV